MKKIIAIVAISLSLGAFAPQAAANVDLVSATNLPTVALSAPVFTNLLAKRVGSFKVVPGEGITIWAKITGTNSAAGTGGTTNKVVLQFNASADGTTNRLSTTNPFGLEIVANTNSAVIAYTNLSAAVLEGISSIYLTGATNHNTAVTNGVILNSVWFTRDKP